MNIPKAPKLQYYDSSDKVFVTAPNISKLSEDYVICQFPTTIYQSLVNTNKNEEKNQNLRIISNTETGQAYLVSEDATYNIQWFDSSNTHLLVDNNVLVNGVTNVNEENESEDKKNSNNHIEALLCYKTVANFTRCGPLLNNAIKSIFSIEEGQMRGTSTNGASTIITDYRSSPLNRFFVEGPTKTPSVSELATERDIIQRNSASATFKLSTISQSSGSNLIRALLDNKPDKNNYCSFKSANNYSFKKNTTSRSSDYFNTEIDKIDENADDNDSPWKAQSSSVLIHNTGKEPLHNFSGMVSFDSFYPIASRGELCRAFVRNGIFGFTVDLDSVNIFKGESKVCLAKPSSSLLYQMLRKIAGCYHRIPFYIESINNTEDQLKETAQKLSITGIDDDNNKCLRICSEYADALFSIAPFLSDACKVDVMYVPGLILEYCAAQLIDPETFMLSISEKISTDHNDIGGSTEKPKYIGSISNNSNKNSCGAHSFDTFSDPFVTIEGRKSVDEMLLAKFISVSGIDVTRKDEGLTIYYPPIANLSAELMVTMSARKILGNLIYTYLQTKMKTRTTSNVSNDIGSDRRDIRRDQSNIMYTPNALSLADLEDWYENEQIPIQFTLLASLETAFIEHQKHGGKLSGVENIAEMYEIIDLFGSTPVLEPFKNIRDHNRTYQEMNIYLKNRVDMINDIGTWRAEINTIASLKNYKTEYLFFEQEILTKEIWKYVNPITLKPTDLLFKSIMTAKSQIDNDYTFASSCIFLSDIEDLEKYDTMENMDHANKDSTIKKKKDKTKDNNNNDDEKEDDYDDDEDLNNDDGYNKSMNLTSKNEKLRQFIYFDRLNLPQDATERLFVLFEAADKYAMTLPILKVDSVLPFIRDCLHDPMGADVILRINTRPAIANDVEHIVLRKERVIVPKSLIQ